MKNTLILPYHTVNKILNSNTITNKHANFINNINIHSFDYLAGPHCINKNHWIAVVINIKNQQFSLLDPYGINDTDLQQHFQNWLQYYNSREDKLYIDWKIKNYNHPIQIDAYNCAVFVCLFIQQIITNGFIDFYSHNLDNQRKYIADFIVKHSEKL